MTDRCTFDEQALRRELREMLRADESAILHALWCAKCASRGVAEQALALGGWTPEEFLSDCADRAEARLRGE